MLEIGQSTQRSCAGVTRRALVQAGFASALGLTPAQQASGAAERSVIVLWLWGGPPHLDTFDPKPDAPSEYRGPYRAIETSVSGVQITELLPRLARLAQRYALIRSLHHGTNDHGLGGAVAMTGQMPQGGRVSPHMGSVVARLRPKGRALTSFVTIGDRLQQGHRLIQGEGGGSLGAYYDPFRIRYDPVEGVHLGEVTPPENVTPRRNERRREILRWVERPAAPSICSRESEALDSLYGQAFALLTNSAGRQVFDLDRESAATRDRYGRTRFGQSCLLARRLVETGVRFVQVNWSAHVEAEEDAGDGGWDNHYRNFEMLADRQAIPFDRACAALIQDLEDRGRLNDTMVVAVGEFGRTPKINSNAGRDHWQSCYSALVAGGGVVGGRVIGASDARGEYPDLRPVTPADLGATMLHSLGIARTDTLALGLPVEGDVIEDLF